MVKQNNAEKQTNPAARTGFCNAKESGLTVEVIQGAAERFADGVSGGNAAITPGFDILKSAAGNAA